MTGSIKKSEEVVLLREGGRRLARIVREVSRMVCSGVSVADLDAAAEELIRAGGDEPAFLGYTPDGAHRKYPATMCVSVNDEVVHGIPNEDARIIQEGDVVSLDCGLAHRGLITDHAVSVVVGEGHADMERLLMATREALFKGISAAQGGAHVGDIGAAVHSTAEHYGYGNVYELGGHGVGYKVHEEPYIPNYGTPGTGPELMPGMILALEPMFTLGKPEVKLLRDWYTYVTKDGSYAAHFEHTILITDGAAEILTSEESGDRS